MSTFSDQFAEVVTGELTMFDRIIFRGYLDGLFPAGAFGAFLSKEGARLTGFKQYVLKAAADLKAHAKRLAREAGRPYLKLDRPLTARGGGDGKQQLAERIARRDGVKDGLVCVLAAVEPCMSFALRRDSSGRLEAVRDRRKCLHIYFYYLDRELGFCHVRLQSWFPFQMQVWMNGREWLANQLSRQGVAFERYENSLVNIADLAAARRLVDRFVKRKWARVLDAFARRLNPRLERVKAQGFGGYNWVLHQAEIATDVMFSSRAHLAKLIPDLRDHAMTELGAVDVMNFLGRKPTSRFAQEVITDLKRRPEGFRIRHWVGRNSIKMYDKWSVLRIETTINQPRDFKALRTVDTPRGSQWQWKPMRKSVGNMAAYLDAGRRANGRYLEALAAVRLKGKGVEELADLCRSKVVDGRRCPKMVPVDAAVCAVFSAALAGGNALLGFRNKDVARCLYPTLPRDDAERERRTAAVSRRIANLRRRGLVAKVPNARLYRPTRRGIAVMGAALRFQKQSYPFAVQEALDL
jgi:hypothetical protein